MIAHPSRATTASTALLAALLSSIALGQTEEPAKQSPEDQVQRAIDAADYPQAVKLAIAHFRPDLHCNVLVAQAVEQQQVVERVALASRPPANGALQLAKQASAQARAFAEQARELAGNYVLAGWDPSLTRQIERLIAERLGELDTLAVALEQLGQRAKSLDALMAQTHIPAEDIERLTPESKVIIGLYLADRGESDAAIGDCFEPAQVQASGVLESLAAGAVELLRGGNTSKWGKLIDTAGLDNYEALRQQLPDQTVLAGWYLTLVARLARDHLEVPLATIKATLNLLDELRQPASRSRHEKLLAAKIEHERFLLARRAEDWTVAPPPATALELFEQSFDHYYAAEAALIAAAQVDESAAADAFLARSMDHIGTLRKANSRIADRLQKHIAHYQAEALGAPGFERWLAIAAAPHRLDRRGTVSPDVLIETRSQFARRVRAGFEKSIARLVDEGRTDAAFKQAQRAKALAVGRLLAPSLNAQAAPISETELVATKLMSTGAGGENQVSRQELFIEYFVGPTRAWAFYVFAPGDTYEPMEVVELQRQALITNCSGVVRAIQTGGQPTDPAPWLLAGEPNVTIASLWDLLGKFKKPDRELRRVVIAPDGPLCYAPLHITGVDVFSSITYLPTAAVLKSAEYINSRDLKLMWDGQRSYLDGVIDEPRAAGRFDGRHLLTLWSGVTMPILLQDAAR